MKEYGATDRAAAARPRRRQTGRVGPVVACTALLGACASLSHPLLSATSTRLTADVSAAASNATLASVVDVFYVEGTEAMHQSYAYDYLTSFVFPLFEQYEFRITTVGSVDVLLARAESDASQLTAGSIVLFGLRGAVVTRATTLSASAFVNYTLDGSTTVDPFCSYQFTDADPLLGAPSVQRLLSWPKPLILVDSNDFSCRADYPPTIHQVWRNSYGSDVMTNAHFLPIGGSYTNADVGFAANASASSATPISARRFALAFMGSLTERKPVRVHFHALMSGGMENKLTEIARDAGLDGIVYDMTREGRHNYTDYTFDELWHASYFRILTHARLAVCLAGDEWADTNLWNVLEFGLIPIVERRPSYKGCRDPTGWLERSGAPVLWLDEWSELPRVVADALADERALEARRRDVVRWYAAAKREFGESMLAFHERWRDADEYPPNDCASVALTDAQERAYQDELDAYYGHEHWFENFPDSPWLSGVFCWKHGKSGSKESSGSRWFGLQCYSPKCAEPVTASFSCGNNTLTAKNF